MEQRSPQSPSISAASQDIPVNGRTQQSSQVTCERQTASDGQHENKSGLGETSPNPSSCDPPCTGSNYIRQDSGEQESGRQQLRQPYSSQRPMSRKPTAARRKNRKTPVKNKGTHAGGRGGLGFSKGELDWLLEILEEHLPIGQQEWDLVLTKHEERYPDSDRSAESLRRKFASLYRKNMPTGDPDIPEEVRRAKTIRNQIVERADIGEDAEVDDIVTLPQELESEEGAGSQNENLNDEQRNTISAAPAVVPSSSNGGTPSPNNPIVPANSRSPVSHTPRPLVYKGSKKRNRDDTDDDLMEMIKLNMLQEQQMRQDDVRRRQEQREEELRQREEDRRRREEERAEERERRETENKRHKKFMQMVMMFMAKVAGQQSQPR